MLVKALPIDVDDFFVDLFYFFNKSAKRKEEFRDFQEFTETKELKILKHCKTRWLSLEKCVQRVIQQWSALYAYFDKQAETDHSARVSRLDQHFKSHLSKLVMLFLEFALESLCKFNAVFQSTLVMLPSLKSEVKRMLRILLGRYMKSDVIKAAGEDINNINVEDEGNEVTDNELGIGHKAWEFMSEEEDYMDPNVQLLFFNRVRGFYRAVSSTIIKKFSFDDNLVDDVAFLLPENRDKVTTALVLRLARRFSAATPHDCRDELEEEALDYILLPQSSLPTSGSESVEQSKSDEVCTYWTQVGKMTTLMGTVRFPNLSQLAKCILSLPVSNAETERVFSIVRKIVTDYRTQIDQKTLFSAGMQDEQ